MSDRHVVPAEDGWQIEKDGAKRASGKAPTQAEAIKRALEIVANDGGGQVVVHGSDGAVRETRAVAAQAGTTAAEAAVTAASAAAKGAAATAGKASDAVSDAARSVADDARRTARTSAEKVERVAHDAAGTAREVADDVAAAGRRAGARVEQVADGAGGALVAGADRAAEVGAGVGDQLEDASHRAGRYIHSFTEQVARPIDAASQALNPVRITGRAVGVVVAGALHVGAVLSRRGTRRARRSARSLTGRR